jgi:mxaJ protein
VSRRDRHLEIRSLDDPRLRRLQIGIQIVGNDYANPPAAQALAARKIVSNVRGYTVFGDYSQSDPQRAVVDAVATGQVDVAVVWGPLGGYYAARERTPMAVAPVTPQQDGPALPFAFDISMAVRKDDRALHDALDAAIAKRGADIRRILRAFDVPLVERSQT